MDTLLSLDMGGVLPQSGMSDFVDSPWKGSLTFSEEWMGVPWGDGGGMGGSEN